MGTACCKMVQQRDVMLVSVGAAVGAALGYLLCSKDSSRKYRHHVLLQLKADATDEQINDLDSALKKLPSLIPEIKAYHVGKQVDSVDDGRNVSFAITPTLPPKKTTRFMLRTKITRR